LLVKEKLIQTVFAPWMVKELYYAALSSGAPINVLVQVDLGMNRLGLKEGEFASVMGELRFYRDKLKLRGIFTHMPLAGEDPIFSVEQVKRFAKLVYPYKRAEPSLFLHVSNSAALLSGYPFYFDGVRVGISLYGLPPLPSLTHIRKRGRGKYRLQPVMSLKSRLISLKWIEEGEGVSYSHTFRAKRRTLIGTVPVGYADGYPLSLSNRAEALFRGKRVRLVGNITMDYLLLDLTEHPDAGIGEEVVLFGESENAHLSAAELAKIIGTIPYEITCVVGKRIRREYIERE
jgi:alanine racemase